MGSWMSLEDCKRRQTLENQLSKIQRSFRVTATSHYITSDYYGHLNVKYQYASYVTGLLGFTSSVLSKVAWKTMAGKYPRFAPIFAANSATMSLFTVVANIPDVPTLPSTLHQLHFKSGVEYQKKKVRSFAKTDVWNSSVPCGETLALRYGGLLKEKKEVSSRIQSEVWAYREALAQEENRKREKIREESFKPKT